MHVAIVRFQLHIPESRSLKQKRAAVKPIVEGIRHRFGVAVAEVDHHAKWQRAALGVAVVAESHRHVVEVVDAVERWVWSKPDIEVADFEARWSSWDDAEDGDGPFGCYSDDTLYGEGDP